MKEFIKFMIINLIVILVPTIIFYTMFNIYNINIVTSILSALAVDSIYIAAVIMWIL